MIRELFIDMNIDIEASLTQTEEKYLVPKLTVPDLNKLLAKLIP
jgi:hypothetical protein